MWNWVRLLLNVCNLNSCHSFNLVPFCESVLCILYVSRCCPLSPPLQKEPLPPSTDHVSPLSPGTTCFLYVPSIPRNVSLFLHYRTWLPSHARAFMACIKITLLVKWNVGVVSAFSSWNEQWCRVGGILFPVRRKPVGSALIWGLEWVEQSSKTHSGVSWKPQWAVLWRTDGQQPSCWLRMLSGLLVWELHKAGGFIFFLYNRH